MDDNYDENVCEPSKKLTDKIVINIVFYKSRLNKTQASGNPSTCVIIARSLNISGHSNNEHS